MSYAAAWLILLVVLLQESNLRGTREGWLYQRDESAGCIEDFMLYAHGAYHFPTTRRTENGEASLGCKI